MISGSQAREAGKNRLLIQVVPRLTPGRCGVSDQVVLLARELKVQFRTDSAFIVLNSSALCGLEHPVIHCAPLQLLENCLKLADGRSDAILVHVSGYGYSADGAPALLADALDDVRANSEFPIAVYFHETFASGPPWRSAFWYSWRQKKAIDRIAAVSDLVMTSNRLYGDMLAARGVSGVQVLPVLSAAGETCVPVPMDQRVPSMVVFGLPATRQRAYQLLSSIEKNYLINLGITEVLDIGRECGAPSNLSGVLVRRLGEQSVADLGRLFSQAMFGFVSHLPSILAKSSIFASYCALGAIPLLSEPFTGEIDGLTDGVQVISPDTVDLVKDSGFGPCSLAAWKWYSEHNLRAYATGIRDWTIHARSRRAEIA